MKWIRSDWFVICAAVAVLSFTGCAQPVTVGPVKTVVSGNVTLDNKPLAQGQIVFVDAEGNEQRKYGDQIINGKYSLDVTPGKKKVEISARESTGGPGSDPGSNLRELIPEQYNTKTTLTAEIVNGNPKGGDFQLTSGPAPAK